MTCAAPLALIPGLARADEAAAGRAVDELTVVGQRLSNDKAIEIQRDAETVTSVVSSDDLGKLPDANVADALARLPGVNVIVNQDTGEGEFVTVRGFAGTFNAYSINGVRVALTDPDNRKLSMTVLPPNGLQAISVAKTLTPDMDGDAIGGTVDFRTPTAFDFKQDVLRAFASYGVNDRARSQHEPADAKQLQFDVSHRFGDQQQFGIFASANWGKNYGHNEETENDGEWEPYRWRKDSQEPIDANSLYLPGIDLDYRRIEQTRFGGNFSLDWKGNTSSLYLRGQYNRFERTGTNDWTDYRSRPTVRLVEANPEDANLVQPDQAVVGVGAKGRIYGYTTAQIVDQDGDGVITDADRKQKSYWSLYGRSGVWNPQAFQFARTFETLDQNQALATVNAGGDSHLGALDLSYDLSYSWGERDTPQHYSVSYNCDACAAPLNQTGLLWSSHDPRFPQPQLPGIAVGVDHNDALLPFDGAGLDKDKQTDKRVALRFDANYHVGGLLDSLKAGFKVMRSDRSYDRTPIWSGDFSGTPLDGENLAQSGLVDRTINSTLHGEYFFGSVMNRERVIAAIKAAMAATPSDLSVGDLNGDDHQNRETILAGYGLAKLELAGWDVIAGARLEHTKVHNTFWVDDGDASGFGQTDRDYTNVLPSVTGIYRAQKDLVVRTALWTSFSRPEFAYISSGSSVTRDTATGEITAISQGNPDLKPAEALNFDASVEWYPDRGSVLSVGVFAKRIRHFIFTNGNQVDADTQSGTIEITQPKNGETAKIYGAEFNLIKSFEGLAAPFDGFGVEANLTIQHSRAETGLDYRQGHEIPFIGAPDLLYNAALTYQKYGLEAKLAYNYQGKYIEDLRDNAVDKWVQPNKSLDLHTRYTINRNLSVDFDILNILDGWRYYTTKGASPSYQKDYMEPGRTYTVRIAWVH
jgi:TonB-dependent receptor